MKIIQVPSFVATVMEHFRQNNQVMCVQVLQNALTTLGTTAIDPERNLFLGTIFLAKVLPNLFLDPTIENILISFFGCKKNPMLPVLSCNVLAHVYSTFSEWPQSFVKIYLSDALSDRVWVDHEKAQLFVCNVVTAFGNPPENPRRVMREGVNLQQEEEVDNMDFISLGMVKTRYHGSVMNAISSLAIQQFKQCMEQGNKNVKNLVKAAVTLAPIPECRLLSATKLQGILLNTFFFGVSFFC